MLTRVNYDTQIMTASEEKAMLNLLSRDPLFHNFVRSQAMHGEDPHQRLKKQPVCPSCESAGFYHDRGMACHKCGYTGPIVAKVGLYLKQGLYK